ncbi:uncharacterized protein METZ01_LOCUS331066, partial [marine metagenome]
MGAAHGVEDLLPVALDISPAEAAHGAEVLQIRRLPLR